MAVQKEKSGLSTDMRGRSWIWKNPDWLSFSDLSDGFLAQARSLDESERKLEDFCSHQKFAEIERFRMLAESIIASWNIEGIRLSRWSVRSSLADGAAQKRRGGRSREGRAAAAALKLLSDDAPLTVGRILSSHAMLKDDGGTDWGRLRRHAEHVYALGSDGSWHSVYEAPPQECVPELMRQYAGWWHASKEKLPRAAGAMLAHLLFVVVHPFRDGNGRMARMLADRYLSEQRRRLFMPYSLSVEIDRHRTEYYMALEGAAEAGGMGRFLDFMLAMHAAAIDAAAKRAKLLKRSYAFLAENGIRLSCPEMELLHAFCANPKRRWSFIEATRDMEDGEEAERVWSSLVEKGFISNGRFFLNSS